MKKYSFIILCLGLGFNFSFAQTWLFQPLSGERPQIGLRFLRPNFAANEDVELSLHAGIYDFTCQFPLSPKIGLIGSLPFAVAAGDNIDSETGLGNIYLGVQMGQPPRNGQHLTTSLGVVLPTAEEKFSVWYLGLSTNFYEVHKFLPNTLTLYGNFAYHLVKSRGGIFDLEFGPNWWFPTEDHEYRDNEFSVHYGILGGYNFTKVALRLELIGLVLLSSDFENSSDRFTHALTFGAQFTQTSIRPGLFYQIYLKEELREFIDGVLGIKFDVTL